LHRRVDILTITLIRNHHGKEEKGSEEDREEESRKEARIVFRSAKEESRSGGVFLYQFGEVRLPHILKKIVV
jgi:hypothetical protein